MRSELLARRLPWLGYGAGLLIMLAAAYGLFQQQANVARLAAQKTAEERLEFLSHLVFDLLQKKAYQQLQTVVQDWGRYNEDAVEISLSAENGFALAHYVRGAPSTRTLPLSTTIEYSYDGHAALSLLTDMGGVYAAQQRLGLQLGLALVLFSVVFWSLVYTGTRRRAEALAKHRQNLALLATQRELEAEVATRKDAEQRLHEEKLRAEVTLHSIGDGVITTDADGRVAYLNPVAERDTGWAAQEAIGRPLAEVFAIVSEATGDPAENPVTQCLRDGRTMTLANHMGLLRRDGSTISIQDSAAPIRAADGHVVGAVVVFHDVSHERELARNLNHQARHDALTGLCNRREFEDRLGELIDSAREQGVQHALLYLDLDQFKVVNDTCGHMAGDELLVRLAKTFRDCIRSRDTLARLGGDEFGVLLEACPLDNALHTAEVMRKAVKEFRFEWGGRVFEIGVSIGLTMITADSRSRAAVLSAADMACYRAKEKGRNRVHHYMEGDAEITERRAEMQWVPRINHAMAQDRFCLYVQPIIRTLPPGQRSAHFEVLLRMLDDDGSIIMPEVFLRAAERFDLMVDVDRWVVDHALAGYHAFARRQAAGIAVSLSINISGSTLNADGFGDYIKDKLAELAVPPQCIIFEITETTAIANLREADRFISALHAIGCRFALDDFGSGLSSFRYLKHLPVDYLKIDGSFVREVQHNAMDRAVIESIHNIGVAMGIQTIAEYVETGAILKILQDIGVDYVQGYCLGRPEPMVAA